MHVAYISPHFTPNTVRFIESLVSLHKVRLVLISQDPVSKMPGWQQSRLAAGIQIPDVCDANALVRTLGIWQKRHGVFHRIMGATEQLQVPLAIARETLGIPGMDVETAKNFRDKGRMKDLLRQAGLPCARHGIATNTEEVHQFINTCPFPVILKPLEGAGSLATFKVTNAEDLLKALDLVKEHLTSGVIIEEFIQGEEYSLDTFSLNGKVLGHTVNQYIPSALQVMENPWMQWQVLLRKEITDPPFDDIRKAGESALRVLGMKTGLSHMEWFRRPDGSIAISEVAARPPGAQFTTIISRACDFDVIKAWTRLMILDEPVWPVIKYSAGAAYLRAQGHGRVQRTEGLEKIRSKYNDIITDIRIPVPGQEKGLNYEGEGFVIVRHPNTSVVEQALQEIVSTVKVHAG